MGELIIFSPILLGVVNVIQLPTNQSIHEAIPKSSKSGCSYFRREMKHLDHRMSDGAKSGIGVTRVQIRTNNCLLWFDSSFS